MKKSKKEFNSRLIALKEYTTHSLNLVEAKHAALIALCIALFIFILDFDGANSIASYAAKTLRLFMGFSLLSTLSLSIIAFFPIKAKQKKASRPTDKENIFRCETIEKYAPKSLKERINSDLEDFELNSFEYEQLEYIIITSKVAARKYRLFRKAVYTFILFGILTIAHLILQSQILN